MIIVESLFKSFDSQIDGVYSMSFYPVLIWYRVHVLLE